MHLNWEVTQKAIADTQIGVMADSHGNPAKIAAALNFFKSIKCRCIFHLGDICDSTHPETVEDCVRPLLKFSALAIRGNNDHQIVVNHDGPPQGRIPSYIIDFLKKLPLVRRYQASVFAHSLPFVHELGLAAMIGVMDQVQADRFFKRSPRGILFRGHSHTPEITWKKGRQIISRTLSANQRVDLNPRMPCVVTCGGLIEGLCMIWRPAENVIESRFFE